MQALRFLHVFPSLEAGGAQLRVINTINFLGPGAGHGLIGIDGNLAAAVRLDPRCEVPVYTGPPKNGPLQFISAIRRQIRELAPRVLITYNWGATDAIIAARLDGLRPVIHNECGFSHEYEGFKWRRAFARRILLRGVARTVVTAESLRRLVLESYRVPEERVQLIKTGVDVDRFRPPGMPRPAAEGVTFGYMGGLRASKNVGMLIRAFAALGRTQDRLVLFGEGPLRTELEMLIADLGVIAQVAFAGHVAAVEDAYASIDVYCTASRSEAASNSLLEAMACGLPAVVTDIADNGVLLCPEQRPFVIPATDAAAYTEALRTMAADPDLRADLGRRNRRRVESEYSLDRMLREYVGLWEWAASQATALRVG